MGVGVCMHEAIAVRFLARVLRNIREKNIRAL